MAAAIGTPLVVLWGPGIEAQTRPLSTSTPIRILNAHVPCAPCYGTPQMKLCVRNICMEQIQPAEVLSAAADLLE
jgi:ADP-heptose:LPS heptosyltransferase